MDLKGIQLKGTLPMFLNLYCKCPKLIRQESELQGTVLGECLLPSLHQSIERLNLWPYFPAFIIIGFWQNICSQNRLLKFWKILGKRATLQSGAFTLIASCTLKKVFTKMFF